MCYVDKKIHELAAFSENQQGELELSRMQQTNRENEYSQDAANKLP